MSNEKMKFVVAALILGGALVCSAYALSRLKIRYGVEQTTSTIRVKGYAKMDIVSDEGEFNTLVTANDRSLNSAYKKLYASFRVIYASIRGDAPRDASFTVSPPRIVRIYKKDAKGHATNIVDYYLVSKNIRVRSKDVEWIKKKNESLGDFLGKGYIIDIGAPAFLLTDLGKVKMKLLKSATANGFQRAKILAGNSGAKVGALCSAKQGVFQITPPNSTDVSDWGCYSTETIRKSAKIVVTLQYKVEKP